MCLFSQISLKLHKDTGSHDLHAENTNAQNDLFYDLKKKVEMHVLGTMTFFFFKFYFDAVIEAYKHDKFLLETMCFYINKVKVQFRINRPFMSLCFS